MVHSLMVAALVAQAQGPSGMPADHPAVDGNKAAPTAAELIKKLDSAGDLKDREKTFEIAASVARLYYSSGRYRDAVVYFEQAVQKAKDARAFYFEQKRRAGSKALPAPASVGCAPAGDTALDELLKLAKEKAKSDPAAAASCVRAGLHPLMAVEAELGNAKFLLKDGPGALAVYDRALELFETNLDARYGRAAVLLDTRGDDLKALGSARADLEVFLRDDPTSPRAKQAKAFLGRVTDAIAAGGITRLAASAPKPQPAPPPQQQPGMPVLTKEMIEAVQNVEKSPEMDQGFARLVDEGEEHLAKGRFQDALDAYKRVVPFQPDNARARAGMAWSLVGLNKPMADNVWRVSLANPEAIDALGDRLKARGDEAGAKRLWQKLKDSAPDYAPKLVGKAP